MLRAKNLAKGLRIQHLNRPNRLQTEDGAKLPEGYKKFWREWKYDKPTPIHHVEEKGRYKLNAEGQVVPVINRPIPIKYTKEQDLGIWGGEGVIEGYRRPAHRYECHVPEYWTPNLLDHVVYSEILDKYLNVTVTQRTIDLIHEHYGFDSYILSTKACDLRSLLACKIKSKLLSALYHKTLYPEDEATRESVYNKYKHFLDGFTREDIEWYGLSYVEALSKNNIVEREAREKAKVPLKIVYRKEFVEELTQMKLDGTLDALEKSKPTLLQKFNPFSKLKD